MEVGADEAEGTDDTEGVAIMLVTPARAGKEVAENEGDGFTGDIGTLLVAGSKGAETGAAQPDQADGVDGARVGETMSVLTTTSGRKRERAKGTPDADAGAEDSEIERGARADGTEGISAGVGAGTEVAAMER